MESLEPLPHFVDDYLSFLYEAHPTAATFDGVHTHDDLLEDFARGQIERQRRDLGGFARRLAAIRAESQAPEQRLDRAMLESDIRARLLEIEQTRNVERNPQLYADTLATSLASQVLFQYAPISERARRIVSKLRQVPSLITAAKANVKEPPGLFVKTALETLRGLLTFLDADLPRACGAIDDLSLLGDLSRQRPRPRSASASSSSRRNCTPTRDSTFRSRSCSTSACASCRRRRKNFARSRRKSPARTAIPMMRGGS
jgi:hypothetical protein